MAETLWLVDSSGWIEYFTDGPNASCFAPAIEQPKGLVVPSLSLLEGPAIQAIALMRQGTEIALDADFEGIPDVEFIPQKS